MQAGQVILAVIAIAVAAIVYRLRGTPTRAVSFMGQEIAMVRQDILDFCTTLADRAAKAVAAAVTTAVAEKQGEIDQLNAAHTEEVAALQGALDAALPPAPPAG